MQNSNRHNTKQNTGLSARQLIALMQLERCGRKTALKIADVSRMGTVETEQDLTDLIRYCKGIGIGTRLPDYSAGDIRMAADTAERIISDSEGNGIGIVGYYDDGFPQALRTLITEKGVSDPPAVLYYKGNLSITSRPSIAIIGTREPTSEGTFAGEFFGQKFAENGFNVVSGLALGCDSAGHRGAMNGRGVTTAFLAHGLDSVYPVENTELAHQIVANGGLLFSEYTIGDRLLPNRLVERDRLQAGLAQATLVIQSGINGGTMHAARATLASDKPLFVVRYRSSSLMESEKVRGNRYLAEQGASYLSIDNLESTLSSLLKLDCQKNELKSSTGSGLQMKLDL